MIPSTATRVGLGDGASTTLEQWGESGPILLCVHGISSSRKSWLRTAEYFAASYRVCAYDQRGHGDSAAVAGSMTLDRSVADLAAVAAALGEPVYALIGHSWGGAVVLLGGPRIGAERVVAIDPMIRQAPGTWRADFVDDLEPVLAVAPAARAPVIREMFGGLPPVEIDAKVHAMRHMDIASVVALGEENGADQGRWDLRASLQAYPLPLLMMMADPAESVVSAADLASVRRSAGGNVQIEVFAGAGHTLQRTAFERYAGALETYLRG